MDVTLQILLCIAAADFVTGAVHWWEDTYGDPNWPLIGKQVIEPNLLHHQSPSAFATMSTMLLRNYQPLMLATVVCGTAWAVGWCPWQLVLVAMLAAVGNEVHAWSHVKPKNWLPKLLQDMAIVQTPHQHAKHHQPPFDDYFCSLTNAVNPVLARLRFWSRLERLIAWTTGIEPKRMTEVRRGL